MSSVKSYLNRKTEPLVGNTGLFLLAAISWACEHKVLPKQNVYSDADEANVESVQLSV